jgi:hypothetical protein
VDVSVEIICTGAIPTVDCRTRYLAAAGKLRKLHSSIYKSNLTETLESIGSRHALTTEGHLLPGTLLSGGTAKEMQESHASGCMISSHSSMVTLFCVRAHGHFLSALLSFRRWPPFEGRLTLGQRFVPASSPNKRIVFFG